MIVEVWPSYPAQIKIDLYNLFYCFIVLIKLVPSGSIMCFEVVKKKY